MRSLNILGLFITIAFLSACSRQEDKKTNENAVGNEDVSLSKNTYMPTGFYFLAGDSTGTKMHLRGSKEIYNIAPEAFASAKNIIKTKVEKKHHGKETYTELCITFDAKGTKDLKEGTGNPLRPKLAVVVANQLLYVINNTAKITTGIMYIDLLDFSDAEIDALQNDLRIKEKSSFALNNKKSNTFDFNLLSLQKTEKNNPSKLSL